MSLRLSGLFLAVGLLLTQVVNAQEPPPSPNPISASAPVPASVAHYHSQSLHASFILQYMYITTQNGPIYFWGARIVGLDPLSPLNTLGLRTGDVITRLDGLRVADGAYQDSQGNWQIPELDRHFALTEIRYIITGTNTVRVGTIDLGSGANSVTPLQP